VKRGWIKFIFSFRFDEDNLQVAGEAKHMNSGASTGHKHNKDIKNSLSDIAYRTNMYQPLDLGNFEVMCNRLNVYNICILSDALSSSSG